MRDTLEALQRSIHFGMASSFDAYANTEKRKDLDSPQPGGVFVSSVARGLKLACHAYRRGIVAATQMPYYTPIHFISEEQSYGWDPDEPRDKRMFAAFRAGAKLRQLLPQALQDIGGAPTLICCTTARPHQDWDMRFLSLVIGTARAGTKDSGYEMGFVPVKRQTRIAANSDYDASLYTGETYVAPLQVGSFLSFNPRLAVHWAEPVEPDNSSLLILLQWELTGAQDRACRDAVAKAYGLDFHECGNQIAQF